MTSYSPGHLRLALMGDILRNPGTELHPIVTRLEVEDPNTIRVTLGRLCDRGLVRELAHGGFMLTRNGLEHLAQVRRWVSA